MRINEVILYGQVIGEPEIQCPTRKRSEVVDAKMIVQTVRRIGDGDQDPSWRYDKVIVFTKNPEIINRDIYHVDESVAYDDVCEGDMVFIKGTLSTWMKDKAEYCKHCHQPHLVRRSSVYVDPLSIHLCERALTEDQGKMLLRKSYELSNLAIMGGWITTDPEYYEDEKNFRILEFAMRGKRIRRIEEDGPDKRSDCPWVKVYGKRALEYSEMYMYGSEIVVVGSVQARNHLINSVCPHCGQITQVEQIATELVPYRIEPVSGCNIPEKPDIDAIPEEE